MNSRYAYNGAVSFLRQPVQGVLVPCFTKGVQEIYIVKIFQIPRGTKIRSLSLLNFKTFLVFLNMNSTTDIYFEFRKTFRATISTERFCLNISLEIIVYWCDWFYFPVRPTWHSKECFSTKFLVKHGTATLCIACLKKDIIPLYA